MAALQGIFQFPAAQRVATVGHVVVGALARFTSAAGKIAASLVTVDADGNVTTPGSVTAGPATLDGVRVERMSAAGGGTIPSLGTVSAGEYQPALFFQLGGVVGVASQFQVYDPTDATPARASFSTSVGGVTAIFDGAFDFTTWSPSQSATLAIESTTGGFLPPRVTSAERDAFDSPQAGLIIFNVTSERLELYNGAAWVGLSTTP